MNASHRENTMKDQNKSRRQFIKSLAGGAMLASTAPLLNCLNLPGRTEKPNILLIFIDDLGWSSLSCYGNRHVPTPNLDRLASQGMRFTDAYVTPQCTPTRASLLTGQHTARLRMWHVISRYGYPYARMKEPPYRENLPHETVTIAEALRNNGYKTALMGKWHLSAWDSRHPVSDGYYTTLWQEGKEAHGFDYVDIAEDPNYHQKTDKGVDYLSDEAVQFMKENKENPFFIYLCQHTIHGPVIAPEKLVQKYRDQGYPEKGSQNNVHYLAAIEHIDNSVGKLLDNLQELGIEDNTVVMFYSDNGGVEKEFSNTPLRAGKGSAYEGGIRVPFIVKWPGHVPEGQVTDFPVHVTDLYPTLLEMTGTPAPDAWVLDGESILPELTGQKQDPNRDLFWYMPLYDWQWGATPAAVIRSGEYKLIKSFGDYYDHHNDVYIPEGRIELFNLKNDIGEKEDLSEIETGIAAKLEKKLMHWITEEMHAPLPEVNPSYDRDRIFDRSRNFNFEPFFERPLPDMRVKAGQKMKIQIPRSAIADYDHEGYNLHATADEGSEWPEWLKYNRFERTFLGTPQSTGKWKLKLTARDAQGAEVSQVFSLVVE